jgi:hypothetical protein
MYVHPYIDVIIPIFSPYYFTELQNEINSNYVFISSRVWTTDSQSRFLETNNFCYILILTLYDIKYLGKSNLGWNLYTHDATAIKLL